MKLEVEGVEPQQVEEQVEPRWRLSHRALQAAPLLLFISVILPQFEREVIHVDDEV